MSRLCNGVLAVALCAGALAGVAQAADDPAEVLAYRRHVMGTMAASISGIFAVLEGKVSYSQHVASHARALHGASLMVLDVFPEGSAVGDSRAKPEIWTDWAKFEAGGKALQTATADLVAAAEGGDMAAIAAAAGKVGEACGGCHKPFRAEKQ
ncbi:MAG: cytochrome c [Alphaproteobacteria bacterium]